MEKFIVFKDGGSWYFALPNFVSLQESDAIFLPIYNADMDYIFELLLNQRDSQPPEVVDDEHEKGCNCDQCMYKRQDDIAAGLLEEAE
jgi:hypothetical protein